MADKKQGAGWRLGSSAAVHKANTEIASVFIVIYYRTSSRN